VAEYRKINDTGMMLPATTLSALVAEQAARTPDAPALADACWQFRGRCVSRWWRWRNFCVKRGVKPGDSVAVALPRSVFLTLALHGIVEAGAAGCRSIPVTRMSGCT
jgi:enterobactin synthetase component F